MSHLPQDINIALSNMAAHPKSLLKCIATPPRLHNMAWAYPHDDNQDKAPMGGGGNHAQHNMREASLKPQPHQGFCEQAPK